MGYPNNESKEYYFSHSDLNPSDDDLNRVFNAFFRKEEHKTTTYKFALLKAILDNLFNVQYETNRLNRVIIEFDKLAYKFTESYWNIVACYGLNQGHLASNKTSKIEQEINRIKFKYHNSNNIKWNLLTSSDQLEIVKNVNNRILKSGHVIGALCGELYGKVYEFNKRSEYFALSQRAYRYMLKNKIFLETVNYSKWAKYLEKNNEDELTHSIIAKLESSVEERHSLDIYKKIFYGTYNYDTCFYCGKQISANEKNNYHIDHFIPWSLIKEDKVWNLVPSCLSCNEKIKRALLAPRDFLKIVKDRNEEIIDTIDNKCNDKNSLIRIHNDFLSYKDNTLKDLYSYAELQGYKSFAR